MIEHPFSLLEPYKNRLKIAMLTKIDDIQTDNQAAALVQAEKLAGLDQIHGNTTVVVREPVQRNIQADGMITDVPGLTLTIRWADCQNFVIYAPKDQVVGVLHAGWRGLHAGAIPQFFRVLKDEFDIDAKDVVVGAGPSLCTQCAEFSDPITELPNIAATYFHEKCVDLRQAATDQLIAFGVPEDAIERSSDCTRCMPETYWTYRGGDREDVLEGKINMLTCSLV